MKIVKKIGNIFLLTIMGLVTLVRFIGIQGYFAAITGDFSYLNSLNLNINEQRQLIDNFMPAISGYLNILFLILGLIIIITLIKNLSSPKNYTSFLIPYILIICYAVIDTISTFLAGNRGLNNFSGALLFVFMGTFPLLVLKYNRIKLTKLSR